MLVCVCAVIVGLCHHSFHHVVVIYLYLYIHICHNHMNWATNFKLADHVRMHDSMSGDVCRCAGESA